MKGEGLVLIEPKSFAGRRALALPPPLVEALRRHRAWQLQQRMAAADVWEDGGSVVAQADGKPIGARTDREARRARARPDAADRMGQAFWGEAP